jgi:hypothetical protein
MTKPKGLESNVQDLKILHLTQHGIYGANMKEKAYQSLLTLLVPGRGFIFPVCLF